MTLHRLGQNLKLQRMRLAHRFSVQSKPINFFEQIDRAEKILLCLPPEEQGTFAALSFLPRVQQYLPNARLTLLYNKEIDISKRVPKGAQPLAFDRSDLSFWGMPGREVREQVRSTGFDVAVDFNLEFDFLSALLVQDSGAPLRLCFDHPRRETFCNLIIRLDLERSWDEAFQALLRVIVRE